jgi:hypothetical protein
MVLCCPARPQQCNETSPQSWSAMTAANTPQNRTQDPGRKVIECCDWAMASGDAHNERLQQGLADCTVPPPLGWGGTGLIHAQVPLLYIQVHRWLLLLTRMPESTKPPCPRVCTSLQCCAVTWQANQYCVYSTSCTITFTLWAKRHEYLLASPEYLWEW